MELEPKSITPFESQDRLRYASPFEDVGHGIERRAAVVISRVRENRMHGLMREGRRKPVLYSTLPNFITMHSIAPEGRAKGTLNLDSERPHGRY